MTGEMAVCETCKKQDDEVNHPPGMIFVGWGHGWQTCPDCGGTGTRAVVMTETEDALWNEDHSRAQRWISDNISRNAAMSDTNVESLYAVLKEVRLDAIAKCEKAQDAPHSSETMNCAGSITTSKHMIVPRSESVTTECEVHNPDVRAAAAIERERIETLGLRSDDAPAETTRCPGLRERARLTHVAVRDTEGRVWSLPRPLRHHHVLRVMHEQGAEQAEDNHVNQGFLDEHGHYLTRKQALVNAHKHKQVARGEIIGGVLTSEDLW